MLEMSSILLAVHPQKNGPGPTHRERNWIADDKCDPTRPIQKAVSYLSRTHPVSLRSRVTVGGGLRLLAHLRPCRLVASALLLNPNLQYTQCNHARDRRAEERRKAADTAGEGGGARRIRMVLAAVRIPSLAGLHARSSLHPNPTLLMIGVEWRSFFSSPSMPHLFP